MCAKRFQHRSRIRLVALTLTAFLLLLAGTFWNFPDVGDLTRLYPVVEVDPDAPNSTIVAFENRQPAHWTKIENISKHMAAAVIVSEDHSFYSHPGFDIFEMKEAFKADLKAKSFKRGASTITQQMIRNVFLNQRKSIFRKARELILAYQVEKVLSKKKILEVYLNVVEFGDGIFGITKAANHYFKKSPSQLRPKEAAFLTMLLPSPKRYSISFRRGNLTHYAQKTIRRILNKMVATKYLSFAVSRDELATPLSFERAATAAPVDNDELDDEDEAEEDPPARADSPQIE